MTHSRPLNTWGAIQHNKGPSQLSELMQSINSGTRIGVIVDCSLSVDPKDEMNKFDRIMGHVESQGGKAAIVVTTDKEPKTVMALQKVDTQILEGLKKNIKNDGYCTRLSPAIRLMTSQMGNQTSEKAVMIILSDGMAEEPSILENAVKLARKQGIEVHLVETAQV